jgi:hypothetical protein
MGEPGGNAGFAAGSGAAAAGGEAAGGEAADGVAGCCAAALSVNAPTKAPASKRRGADEQIIMIGLPVWKPVVQAQTSPAPAAFLGRNLRYFSRHAQSETLLELVREEARNRCRQPGLWQFTPVTAAINSLWPRSSVAKKSAQLPARHP